MKTRLDLLCKSTKLSTHALQNLQKDCSEHRWEQDINASVFASMRDDERLSLDKRAYHYLPGGGKHLAEFKAVDETLGLATYKDDYNEYIKDRASGDPERRPRDRGYHEFLVERRLQNKMRCSHSGLLVDDHWGEASLILPFAVYEAKKKSNNYKRARLQAFHVAQIYLGMLDDPSRDPNDVAKHQFDDSDKYQVFIFTSCGPVVEVWVAHNASNTCVSSSLLLI